MVALISTARCAKHAELPAVDVCQRCGGFICGDCLELREGKPYCSDCFVRGVAGPASKRAIAAVVLGVVGLNCGFVPGMIGLLLSYRELGAIDRGESPETGRSLARGARVLGWINTALLVSALVALAFTLLN